MSHLVYKSYLTFLVNFLIISYCELCNKNFVFVQYDFRGCIGKENRYFDNMFSLTKILLLCGYQMQVLWH